MSYFCHQNTITAEPLQFETKLIVKGLGQITKLLGLYVTGRWMWIRGKGKMVNLSIWLIRCFPVEHVLRGKCFNHGDSCNMKCVFFHVTFYGTGKINQIIFLLRWWTILLVPSQVIFMKVCCQAYQWRSSGTFRGCHWLLYYHHCYHHFDKVPTLQVVVFLRYYFYLFFS